MKGLNPDYFGKRPAVMRSFASGEAGWHVLLLFYSNALFAFDCITTLLDLHQQEPCQSEIWPKARRRECAGAHQQLLFDVQPLRLMYKSSVKYFRYWSFFSSIKLVRSVMISSISIRTLSKPVYISRTSSQS